VCIAAAENFRAVRYAPAISASSAFAGLEAVRSSMAPVLSRLETVYGIPRTSVVVMSSFRTGLNRIEVASLRALAEKSENFNTTLTGAIIPLDQAGAFTPEFQAHMPCVEDEVRFNEYDFSTIEAMVTGTFDSPQFCCQDNRFGRDPVTGEFRVLNQEKLEFLLFIPKARLELGIKPPYPVVVFHHAFQVCKESLIALAGELARFGFASASFDMVNHGSRAHKPNCSDGKLFCNTAAFDFIKPDDISTTVSYLEQTLLDDLAFAKMLKGLKVDVSPVKGDAVTGKADLLVSGDGVNDIDATIPFGFISQSLGSYLGVSVVAMEPHYDRAVFNVGLGGFYKFIVDGIQPGGDMNVLDDAFAGYIAGIQNICDRVEAMNYADLIAKAPAAGRAPVNTLFQGALNDEVIPHSGSDMISYTLGLEQLDALRKVADMPQVGTARTGHTWATACRWATSSSTGPSMCTSLRASTPGRASRRSSRPHRSSGLRSTG
jgi:hypothetical protein